VLVYLHEAMLELKNRCTQPDKSHIFHAIYKGVVLRLCPKLMTLFAILGGLILIMYINGVVSEVVQRIASPMIGGVISSAFLTLIVIPAIFYILAIKQKESMEDCDLSH
jgi:Cu(I)/Ag(I) efflux system membrane protein CusA/SilA